MFCKGAVKGLLAHQEHGLGMAAVNAVRGHVGDAAVTMLGVVPGEEYLAIGTGILDTAKARGEAGPVLQGLELGLRIGVVVRDVGSAMTLGDVQIDEQRGNRFGAHACAVCRPQHWG